MMDANRWSKSNSNVTISQNGLNVSNNTNEWQDVFAVQTFLISGPQCRMDEFPGTILYYYEVKVGNSW
jgi:hypothetical protein